MLTKFLRTSHRLVLRRINNFTPVLLNQCAVANTLNSDSLLIYRRKFSANASNTSQPLEIINPVVFEQICNETLESLSDYFEEIVEKSPNLQGADITYSDGVLTVILGTYGTYVINRQSPNKQIWLSSPVSGPKRYDLILKDGGYWVYKHDGMTLHKLLQEEISKVVETKVDFGNCSHGVI
ncbi:unnamed protein product [Parnassius apollo]|uniref:(apollo) hypothetical protein n=1 Tax=Parnassius apollo TaxID=110799 RepID=A0A8S3XV15_PARAO|nr:unnamed protein product [Parnassius apollo]